MMTHSNIGRTVRGYRLFRTVLSMGVLCIGLLGFNASAMAAVTAKMTSPVANATVAEPGRFVLTATATSTGGTIKNVAFYSGTTLLNTDTTSPYTFTWNNVAAGTYVLKAKATDSKNATATSTTVTVTVTKVVKAYYIDVDHLNTPRAVTNSTGAAVWTWDNVDPYGANVPNENPGGLGAFAFNLRFPGQYFDKETSTHYNYFRDYDPAVGRYVESDPIGLGGGINTYTYVNENPLSRVDKDGLLDVHGNWCGPDWTGGHRHPYTPVSPRYYKSTVDDLDQACKDHDICFFQCREQFPCNKQKRIECFRSCNGTLAKSARMFGGVMGTIVEEAMKIEPNPEQNGKFCGACNAK